MNKRAILVSCACVVSVACAGIPRITPVGGRDAADLAKKCAAPFLKGPWRLVHSIEGTLPGGATAAMIGISLAWPDTGKLRCTLMSIEGLVLLDAEYDSKLIINRGIGPLASPDLVMGMLRDIRLMLFAPKEHIMESGILRDGTGACHYRSETGDVLIIKKKSGVTEIRSYDRSLRLSRTVRFLNSRSDGLPGRLELDAAGLFGYSLRLDLIEAERIR